MGIVQYVDCSLQQCAFFTDYLLFIAWIREALSNDQENAQNSQELGIFCRSIFNAKSVSSLSELSLTESES